MTKILLIEDETALRGEVARWLRFENYNVIDAADGTTGLKYALTDLPDLIISDIAMPGVDGYAVLLETRANETTAHIPFIFMTARVSHEDRRLGMALGADDYITKPFTRLELLQSIQARLEKQAAQDRRLEQQIEQFQKALSQEREEHLFKVKLVAMFSHDFRNQLTAILACYSLIRNYSAHLDENGRTKHLNRIEAATRVLLQMLDDMLILAEMEVGQLSPDEKPLDVGQFLQDIIEEFQVVAGEKHLLQLESHFSYPLMADSRLLRQIATNLISNAVKYSPQGGEIRILLDNRDGQCILSVQDQGIGISEAAKSRIFNAFQRGDNVGKISGTGLGLAIVKQAVDLQGGTIQIESELGAGTTVTVTLPYVTV